MSKTRFDLEQDILNSLGIYPWGPVVMVTSGILWSIVSIAWGDRGAYRNQHYCDLCWILWIVIRNR
jgi:hypothetical protein